MERIYLYTPNQEKRNAVRSVCEGLGMETLPVGPSDLNRYVAEVIGADFPIRRPVPPEKAPVFFQMPEMMLFYGLTDERLDVFLAAYREAKIDPINCKAIVTPYNLGWTIFELAGELKKEHAQMNR